MRGLVLDDVRYLLIVSRGSSSNVARYMQYLFGTVNRLPVSFAIPSLYTVYDTPPALGPAAAIGISQSGASPDVVAVLNEARRQRRPTLAITNDPDSPLARAADYILPLHAGKERAVAATKTYLNSIGAVAVVLSYGCPNAQAGLKIEDQLNDVLLVGQVFGVEARAQKLVDDMHTQLADVQRRWPGAVGEAIAAEAAPVRERGGVLTVSCSASVWAQELDLMAPQILCRLNELLGEARVQKLRCVAV